jgi:VanZ family protein
MYHLLTHPIGRWLPAAVWMLVIFWFSAQSDLPRADEPLLELVFKKGAHIGAYAVLAMCYWWGIGHWRHRWIALLLAIVYAASDEYHQSWTPGRNPTSVDVAIDTAGALFGLWVVAPRGLKLLQKQFKVGLVVAPKEPPQGTTQPIDRVLAKPKAQHRPND